MDEVAEGIGAGHARRMGRVKPSDMPRDIRYYRPGEPFEEGGALHLTRMGDLREVFVREKRDGAFTWW